MSARGWMVCLVGFLAGVGTNLLLGVGADDTWAPGLIGGVVTLVVIAGLGLALRLHDARRSR